jgi:hypothetical protein
VAAVLPLLKSPLVAPQAFSAVASITIDISAAAPTITTLASTNVNAAPTITGFAEALATVTLTAKATDGSSQTFSTQANGSGAWSINTGITANGGGAVLATNKIWAFTATQTDLAGNTSLASAAQTLKYDTTSATPTVANLADNATTASQVTLVGTAEASDVLGNVTVKVYDGATLLGTTTTDYMGGWSYTTTALSNGAHTLKVEQVDAAGNTSSQLSKPITVDTSALSVPSLQTIEGLKLANNRISTTASFNAANGYGVSGWVKFDSTSGTQTIATGGGHCLLG